MTDARAPRKRSICCWLLWTVFVCSHSAFGQQAADVLVLIESKRYETAAELIPAALKNSKKEADREKLVDEALRAAKRLAAKAKTRATATTLAEAVWKSPVDVSHHLAIADVFERCGKDELALQVAEALIEKLARRNPEAKRLSASEKKLLKEARSVREKLVPWLKDLNRITERAVSDYVKLATQWAGRRRLHAARAALALAEKLDPDHPDLPGLRAELRGRSGPGWTVVFRSSDPSKWNTTSKRLDDYAVPLSSVPKDVRFLRLTREDTHESVIIPITKADLTGTKKGSSFQWKGDKEKRFGAIHLGVCFTKPWGREKNKIVIWTRTGGEFLGWGFGHVAYDNNAQGYSWNGKRLEKTIFSIAVKSRPLTKTEAKDLVGAR